VLGIFVEAAFQKFDLLFQPCNIRLRYIARDPQFCFYIPGDRERPCPCAWLSCGYSGVLSGNHGRNWTAWIRPRLLPKLSGFFPKNTRKKPMTCTRC